MSTEIELKYLVVNRDASSKIFSLLKSLRLPFSYQIKQLANCYFDTADLTLRHLDMGLRVRTCKAHIEQTIKTAGIVVGGLHKRPEYNVDIDSAFPTLSLFPQNIWPEGQSIEHIQNHLVALFDTDFVRETWLISLGDTEIELAFDQGVISSEGRTTDIREIELELVKGESEQLLTLAEKLFHVLTVRPGIQSKAARGYRLFHQLAAFDKKPTPLNINNTAENTCDCFIAGIEASLQKMQLTLSQFFHFKSLSKLAEFLDQLALLRHGFWLFEDALTEKSIEIRNELSYFIQLFAWVDNAIYLKELMNKTGNYRKKLDYSQQLIEQLKIEKRRFPTHEMITELLHSERFNLLQLNLLKLVTAQHRSEYFSEQENVSLLNLAANKLSENLSMLTQGISSDELDAQDYLDARKLLHRSLLTGYWFGCYFDQDARNNFRTPWQDMQEGLRELQNLWVIKQQLEKLEIDDDQNILKIIKWKKRKVENLLLALEHSKAVALAQVPYWLH